MSGNYRGHLSVTLRDCETLRSALRNFADDILPEWNEREYNTSRPDGGLTWRQQFDRAHRLLSRVEAIDDALVAKAEGRG